MKKAFVLSITLLLTGSLNALAVDNIASESMAVDAIKSERFITKLKLPSGQTAVISEGEFEARSIGSFAIRLYQKAAPENETTFFGSGIISERDGTVEEVVLDDINADSQAEIIVIVRSAGSGGYLSAHAFTIENNQTLVLDSTVEGLKSDADPVFALKHLKR